MLWNQEDFLREVHRQLVELEALRKRVTPGSPAYESVERLLQSHRQLLRKLSEWFVSGSPTASPTQGGEESSSGANAGPSFIASLFAEGFTGFDSDSACASDDPADALGRRRPDAPSIEGKPPRHWLN